MFFQQVYLFILASLNLSSLATAFAMSNKNDSKAPACGTSVHPSELPGDPSLLLVTNLDLGDKKMDVMKKCSKAISEATGKPEAYIGVSITDNASVIFGCVE